jgi:hypothetical protein
MWVVSARSKMRIEKAGFHLAKNDHGLTVWKKQDEDEMDSNQYSEVRSEGLDRNGC